MRLSLNKILSVLYTLVITTIYTQPHRNMKNTLDLSHTAFLAVDLSRTFTDKKLAEEWLHTTGIIQELYVPGGEDATIKTKEIIDYVKHTRAILINIMEQHPLGHISLASSYINKELFSAITLEDINTGKITAKDIAPHAKFTFDELKYHLQHTSKRNSQTLWPDHSITGTPGVELMPPLRDMDFDITFTKGINPKTDAYSGFDGTGLDHYLKENRVKNIVIAWWVALDYCPGDTALDAANLWYNVRYIKDWSRWIAADTSEAMIKEFARKWIQYISFEEFKNLIELPQQDHVIPGRYAY